MNDEKSCKFNPGVRCDTYLCAGCGWHPMVSARRRKNLPEREITTEPQEPEEPRRGGRRKSKTDEEAMAFIREHLREFGGDMTVRQVQKELRIGEGRLYLLMARMRELRK